MILTAVVLSTGTVALIALGSTAGGALLTAGSYTLYNLFANKDNPDAQSELRQINQLSRQNLHQEVQSFAAKTNQIHAQLHDTVSHIVSNQEAIHYIENYLNERAGELHQHQEPMQIAIVDLDEANKQLNLLLQGYLAIKNDFNQLSKDYQMIVNKYQSLVEALKTTVNDYSTLKKELMDANGARDYTGNMIDLVKRMSTDKKQMSLRMEQLTAQYAEKEKDITTKSQRIAQLLDITNNQRIELEQTKAELQRVQRPLPTTSGFFRPN